MITIRAWNAISTDCETVDPTHLDLQALQSARLVWIDMVGDEPDAHRAFLQEKLGLPRLAVNDALRTRHPPKFEALVDDWRFLLMRGFDVGSTSVKFGTIQLAVFWRHNVLVTRHATLSASVASLEVALSDATEPLRPATIGDLLYVLLRRLLDLYMPLALKIEARLEEIEEQLLRKPSDRLLGELMEFSSQLKRLRRISAYHEKAFASMDAHPVGTHGLDAAQAIDLMEHAERLNSLSSLLYDTTKDLTDGYLSVSSHRLNNVMRLLTVVTVLFVPLTFIAGVYGMNFDVMPELRWRWGYFAVLGLMAALVVGLLALFRRRGWL